MEDVNSTESLSNSPSQWDKARIYTLEAGGEGQQDGRKDARWKGEERGKAGGWSGGGGV